MNRILHRTDEIVISEQPPCRRTILVDGKFCRLHFPYTLFLTVSYHHVPSYLYFFVYGSDSPVRSIDQEVYILPLPNVYSSGHVCLGQALSGVSNLPVAEYHAKANHLFWQTEFKESALKLGFWPAHADNWKKANQFSDMNYSSGKAHSLRRRLRSVIDAAVLPARFSFPENEIESA